MKEEILSFIDIWTTFGKCFRDSQGFRGRDAPIARIVPTLVELSMDPR
jgi:hypothetical protein